MSDEEKYSSSEYESEEEESEESEEEETEEEEKEEIEQEEKKIENMKHNKEKKVEITKQEEKRKQEPFAPKKSSLSGSDMTSPEADNAKVKKMTHHRKNQLKTLILNKAREELKREAARKAEEKKAALSKRLEPLGDLSMSQQELVDFCRELHAKIDKVDEQRYDIEAKVKKNDLEIKELNQKIFDLRGRFKRPPLRRVRMSADQMLRALLGSKHKVSLDLRSNLKAVKKDTPKKEETEAKDWRENVEAKQGVEGKVAAFRKND